MVPNRVSRRIVELDTFDPVNRGAASRKHAINNHLVISIPIEFSFSRTPPTLPELFLRPRSHKEQSPDTVSSLNISEELFRIYQVRMAEWSKALRSGRSPLLRAWVQIPLLTKIFYLFLSISFIFLSETITFFIFFGISLYL